MKKIIIIIPIFNDWESLKKLLLEINIVIAEIKNISFECFVINDSSNIEQPKIIKPKYLHSLKIFNMQQNRGHARCYAFGIRYVFLNEQFDNIILMDGDGEDRPIEIKSLVEKINNNEKISVVAKRVKRSEGFLFKFLYECHKILTYISTGKKINFGNYSCLTKKDVELISNQHSLWSSFSGTIKKNLRNLNQINSVRGKRYFGPSKMSFIKLLIHSLSIIAVFKYSVILRSIIFLIVLTFLIPYQAFIASCLQILIISFNFIILLVSSREKKDELLKSQENLLNINEITH